MNKINFPIICYFDDEATAQIRTLQEEISIMTGSVGSLEVWLPHLTVGSAVLVEENKLESFYKTMEEFVSKFKPVEITLKNFSFLDDWIGASQSSVFTPYVIYLEVENYEGLREVAITLKEITDGMERSYNQPWPYLPHVTVAYKDLDKEGFEKAKELLSVRGFEKKVILDHIAIAVDDPITRKCTEYKRFYFAK